MQDGKIEELQSDLRALKITSNARSSQSNAKVDPNAYSCPKCARSFEERQEEEEDRENAALVIQKNWKLRSSNPKVKKPEGSTIGLCHTHVAYPVHCVPLRSYTVFNDSQITDR